MKPIDKAFWDHLSEKQKWDSIVGLRGPDLGPSGSIKWFTTSVIRHRLSGVMRVGGQVNPDLNAIVVPIGGVYPSKTAAYPGPGGKVWTGDTPVSCSHGADCKVCAALVAELGWYRALPLWDYSHWVCHTMEAAHELDIPVFSVDGKRWWEILSSRGLKSAATQLIEYFQQDRTARPEYVTELERHLVTLSTGALGGW